ncbi:MAG: hypothetical protein U5R30_10345 [Deltaproteobacteria bacterium]|nr:hypothetical protein [Deltaproteobacteria bacterium]
MPRLMFGCGDFTEIASSRLADPRVLVGEIVGVAFLAVGQADSRSNLPGWPASDWIMRAAYSFTGTSALASGVRTGCSPMSITFLAFTEHLRKNRLAFFRRF